MITGGVTTRASLPNTMTDSYMLPPSKPKKKSKKKSKDRKGKKKGY